ncbi:MAG TPA: NAD(P)/FAD-dependent oxidoreductase [Mycobacteriales bacterium]|nr:NAD(P)/FAD-dependent oxidoreductase [Mycobacteriales bacterium]
MTGESAATTLPTDVDVAVIGAGHNGLVAACYLAKAGLRVTVVEASPEPGGMTASGHLIPEAPEHIINSCAVDLISMLHSQVPHELDLRTHGLQITKPDPSYVSLAPDGSTLALWRDPRRTASEIAAYSRADAEEFLEFMSLLDRVITTALPLMGIDTARPSPRLVMKTAREGFRNRKSLSDIVALLSGSASQAVDERFDHPVVKGALLNLAAGAGPVDVRGSGVGFLLLALISRVGVGRPVGGMQSLTEALVGCLESHGGSVVTDAEVVEVLHAAGRVRGLRLRDGREVLSRAVVSSADPWTTLRTLVSGDAVDRRTAARLDHSSANGAGSGVFKIDMALSAQARTTNHERTDGVDLRKPTLLIATEESVRDSYASAARGELPSDPAVWVALPSAEDPSQAPAGQDSAYIYALAVPVAPPEGWQRLRQPAVDSVLGKLDKYLEPLESAELGRIVETPADLANRLRTRNGCITHIDMGFFNTGPFRPTVGLGLGKTPLAGLFLGGSGTHPGGGVSGLPGRTAAQRTLRHLKKA